MPSLPLRCALATLGVVWLALGGCTSTPPSRFYILPPLANADTAPLPSTAKRELTLGVGPVTLPPYLDRPQIVTRASRTKLDLADFDQWAASLQDTCTRVLAENLSLLIPTDRVVLHPWPRTTVVDYQVTVQVERFDSGIGGEVVLAARWSIMDADGNILIMRKSRFQTAARTRDYEATVTAMSSTLEELSRDIATTLLNMVPPASAR